MPVFKLLGHANMRNTQIYAKIVDENKRKTFTSSPSCGTTEKSVYSHYGE